jgi:hypothetical protein
MKLIKEKGALFMQIKHFYLGCMLQFVVVMQLIFPVLAVASTDCPRANARGHNGIQVEFGQYQFVEGYDLAMGVQSGAGQDIKRVSYDGIKTEGCHYKTVAIIPGGGQNQWGWHLAWAGSHGLNYARMDGQAWVSSPPKRFSKAAVSDIRLQAEGSALSLLWYEQQGDKTVIFQAVSHDEGRSWEQPQQVSAAD